MKKLATLFICAFFTISTFAQETKEPTKKETFDFIVDLLDKRIERECSYVGSCWDILDFKIINYDFDALTIELSQNYYNKCDNGFCNYVNKYILDLNHLKEVKLSSDNRCNVDGLDVKFKKQITIRKSYDKSCEDSFSEDQYDVFTFSFKNTQNLNRLKKAMEPYNKNKWWKSKSGFV